MESETSTQGSVRAPRGFHAARVDDKGRLKLPAKFQEYLGALKEPSFFVTTMGRGIVRIYPNSVWENNEKFFGDYTADPKAAQRMAFTANAYGGDMQMDAQGRLLLPAELRQKLGLENSAVQLLHFRGRVDVYKQSMYEEQMQQSEESIESDLDALERDGLR